MKHRRWTNEEDKFMVDNYETMSNKKIAKKLNRTIGAVKMRASILFLNAPKQQYALYQNGNIVAIGTAKELAEKIGVREKTIRYYSTPSYRKRIAERKNPKNYREVVRLDD